MMHWKTFLLRLRLCFSSNQCPEELYELIGDYSHKLTMVFVKKDIFIIADESEINSGKFINILAGDIVWYLQIYTVLINKYISGAVNSVLIENSIKNACSKYNIGENSIKLLISDAALYMIKAGSNIKKGTVTCFNYL